MDLLSQFQFGSGGGQFLHANSFTAIHAPQVLDHPKQIRSITIDRCSNFTSGGANGNDINLLSQLYKARTNSEEFISLLVYSVPDLQRIPFEKAIQQEFRPTRLGEWFGPSWVKIYILYGMFYSLYCIVDTLVSCSNKNTE